MIIIIIIIMFHLRAFGVHATMLNPGHLGVPGPGSLGLRWFRGVLPAASGGLLGGILGYNHCVGPNRAHIEA